MLVYIGLHQWEILKHSSRNEAINKTLSKYENLIVMGDFNRDIKRSNSDKDKLENSCDLFNLKSSPLGDLLHEKS